MADFTEPELAYKQRVEEVKATLPDSFCTVKNNPLETKLDLARSLLLFSGTTYADKGRLLFAPSLFFETATSSPRTLNGRNIAYQIVSTSSKNDRLRFLDTTIEQIETYLPELHVSIPAETPFWTSREAQAKLAQFREHLRLNRDRLLRGPPHANEHTINPVKATEWVEAQKSPERKRLAALLLKHIRYIPHTEFLGAIRMCVRKASELLVPGKPVVFLIGEPDKSNYYVSLLFAHFWMEAGLPIDGVASSLYRQDTLSLGANFLDIDDMAYSGRQTVDEMSYNFSHVAYSYRNILKPMLERNPQYTKTYMFLPRHVLERSLHEAGFRYILVRAFVSELGFQNLTVDKGTKLPFHLATSEVIPYLPGVSEDDKRTLEYTFAVHPPATTVYFDHKVADAPSTFSHVIAQGIVPQRMIAKNIELSSTPIRTELLNAVEGTDDKYIPFLTHCEDVPHLPGRDTSDFWEIPERYRCPFPWYKQINWNNPSGGKRKTRKQGHAKSMSHRNLGSKARQKRRATARSSKGSRTGLKRKASSKS